MEAEIHYLELVQSALHRHNYTYLSEFNCDVVQIISCLYPGHLKNQLHQATAKDDINWTQFKILADHIVSSLKTSRMSIYYPLPNGKSIPIFNPVVQPLSPPLKAGSTISPVLSHQPIPIDTMSIKLSPSPFISSDMPKDPYKVIPDNPGKQRFSCANCHSDMPFRHYYLQCDKVCQFKDCISKHSLPHWGNTCPVLANHLKSKRSNSALSRQNNS